MGLRDTAFTCIEGLSVNRMSTDRCAIWGMNKLYGIMVGEDLCADRIFLTALCMCVGGQRTGWGPTMGILPLPWG